MDRSGDMATQRHRHASDPAGDRAAAEQDSRGDVIRAYAPYLIVVVVFVLAQIALIKSFLDSVTIKFQWPGLHLLTATGKPSMLPTFNFNWALATGTLLLGFGVRLATERS